MVLFIYGAGGAGNEVYDLATRNKSIRDRYSKILFVDDNLKEGDFYGTSILHFESCKDILENETAEFVISVGEPSVRKKLYDKVKNAGYKFATLIDETAIVAASSTISEGCVVYAYAIVSSDAMIRPNCFLMFQSIVGHHAVVGESSVVCPKATVGGHSIVGEQTFLGLGSSMIQGANIGNNVIVGLGAMVFKDVDDGATVVGNPARVTKGSESHTISVKIGDGQ